MILPTVVIFDADSTLFDTSQRHHLSPRQNIGNPEVTWDSYASTCNKDEVFPGVVELARLLKAAGHLVYIVTARSGKWRDHTLEAINRHDVPCDLLYMLEENAPQHHQDDHEAFKRETLQHIRKSAKVVLAVEDWPHLVKMYENEGVPAVCVKPMYGEHSGDSYNNV